MNNKEIEKTQKLPIKKYIRWTSVSILIIAIIVGGFIVSKNYLNSLNKDIDQERRIHVDLNDSLKEYITKNKELQKTLEEVEREKEDFITNQELIYKSKITTVESKLEREEEIRNNLRVELDELYEQLYSSESGYLHKTRIINSNVDIVNEDIDDVNKIVREKTITISFDEYSYVNNVLSQYIHKEANNIWVYTAIATNNDNFFIVKQLLNESTDKSYSPEVICYGNGKDYGGSFRKLSWDRLEYQCTNTNYIIDLKSGVFLYAKLYSSYPNISFANNGSYIFTDEYDTLCYHKDDITKDIFYGYSEDNKYRGGGYYIVPHGLNTSLSGEYQSFWLGHYESSSGPYILDNNGNLVYKFEKGSYSMSGIWVSDNKYLSIQDLYNGMYIHVLDFENKIKTILSEDLASSPVLGLDGEFKGLYYNDYGKEHYLEIFNNHDYTQYVELSINNSEIESYGQKMVCIDQRIYNSYIKDNQLIIDEYSFEFEDIMTREVKTSEFVTTQGYDWLYDNLFLSKSKRNSKGEPSLYVYSNDRQRLINVDSFDDLKEGKLYLDNDTYNWDNNLLFDNRIMIEEKTGLAVKEDKLKIAIGHNNYKIISGDRGHDRVAYTVSTLSENLVTISTYISLNEEAFKLVYTRDIPLPEYDEEDWTICFYDGYELLYDVLEEDGLRAIYKYKAHSEEHTLFMENVKNPFTLEFREKIRVKDSFTDEYHMVSLAGIVLHTYPEKIVQFSNYGNGFYYLQEVDGVEEVVAISIKGDEVGRIKTMGYEVIRVENFSGHIRVHLLEWMTKTKFEKHLLWFNAY